MIRTFQSIRMFEGMTVYESIRVARYNVYVASTGVFRRVFTHGPGKSETIRRP